MHKIINKIKQRKLLTILLLIIVISFIIGILLIAFLSKDNKSLITSTLNNFFLGLKKGNFNYSKTLFNTSSKNILLNTIIWLLGISIIGFPIIIISLISKSLILGFSLSSIIYNYHFIGIIYAIIYIIPLLINLFVTFIMSYYALNFSLLLFNYLFRKKDYNKIIIVKRYLKVLLYSTITIIISSFIETFLIPNLLKLL